MRQYTTETMRLFVEGHDLTGCDVRVTIKQGPRKLTISDPTIEVEASPDGECEGTLLTFTLSQAQTGMFDKSSACKMQVNYINEAGVRRATNIVSDAVLENLLSMEITYGE